MSVRVDRRQSRAAFFPGDTRYVPVEVRRRTDAELRAMSPDDAAKHRGRVRRAIEDLHQRQRQAREFALPCDGLGDNDW